MSKPRLAAVLEAGLFAARWIVAPFYVGLSLALLSLLGVFVGSLIHETGRLLATTPDKLAEAGTLMTLSLIDLSLAANLLIIVILSGYENFVSRIDAAPFDNRPAWMGTVDFAGLKMRLIASIVAISAVALLRTYLEIGDHPPNPAMLLWQALIPLIFVIIGVLMGLMDWLVGQTEALRAEEGGAAPPASGAG